MEIQLNRFPALISSVPVLYFPILYALHVTLMGGTPPTFLDNQLVNHQGLKFIAHFTLSTQPKLRIVIRRGAVPNTCCSVWLL